MDFPAPAPVRYDQTERPWRRALWITIAIAALELIALVVIALAFIAKPFTDEASAGGGKQPQAEAAAVEPRAQTPVLVLNGNGVTGAAGAAARQVRKLEYPVVGVGDAARRDFSRTVVMYREGARPAAVRLARDLGLPAGRAIPLDGLRAKDLRGAELALVLGRR